MYYFKYLIRFNETGSLNIVDPESKEDFENQGCEFLLNYYKNKTTLECINIFKKLTKELRTKYNHPTTNNITYYGMPPEMLPLYFFELVFEEILTRDITDEIKNEIIYLKTELYNVAFYKDEMILYNLEYDRNIFKDLTLNLFPLNYPKINEQVNKLLNMYSGLLVDELIINKYNVTRINVDFFLKKTEYLKTMLEYLFPEQWEEMFKKIDYHLNEFLHDMLNNFTIDDLKKPENIKNLELIIVLIELSLYEDDFYYEFRDELFEEVRKNEDKCDGDEKKSIPYRDYLNYISTYDTTKKILNKLQIYLEVFVEHTIKDYQFIYYYTVYKAQKYKKIICYFEKLGMVFFEKEIISNIEEFHHIAKIKDLYDLDPMGVECGYYDPYYLYWTEPLGGYPAQYKKKEEETTNNYYEDEDECYSTPAYDPMDSYIKTAFNGDEEDFENYYEGIIDRYD